MPPSASDTAIVVVGIGELGSLFSRGFLRNGHSVFPVVRSTKMADVDVSVKKLDASNPLLVLVAVDMTDLRGVLEAMPDQWKDRVVLIQNELLPRHWSNLPGAQIVDPSVVVVWLEKKKGMDTKLRPFSGEVVYSPHQRIGDAIEASLHSLDIRTSRVSSPTEILCEMVVKNMLNLVMNVGGLALGPNSTFGDLLGDVALLDAVLDDAVAVQQAAIGTPDVQPADLKPRVVEYVRMMGSEQRCQGRYARARLMRALEVARDKGIRLPKFEAVRDALPPA